MKTKLFRSVILIAAALHPLSANAESIGYGQKFTYEPVREIEFPDFRLKFLGAKQNGFYPGTTRRLGDIFEFEVLTPNATKVIRWSSGTGDIGPTVFEVQGKCVLLELERSDGLGVLSENEAVVSLDRRSPSSCIPQE